MYALKLYGTEQYARLQRRGEDVIGWDSVDWVGASKMSSYTEASILRRMLEMACVGQTFSIDYEEEEQRPSGRAVTIWNTLRRMN